MDKPLNETRFRQFNRRDQDKKYLLDLLYLVEYRSL